MDDRDRISRLADAFAYEHGRRDLLSGKGKFSRPDTDLFWGLKNGFIAGAESEAAHNRKLLERIGGMCGAPDAADACRNILKVVKEALYRAGEGGK